MLTQKRPIRRNYFGPHSARETIHANARYGLFYPPNHLRIAAFGIDPENGTRGVIEFDRDVAGAPGGLELWAGDVLGFNPQIIAPRLCRVEFNGVLQGGAAWSFDPAAGTFAGVDGCAGVLACGGIIIDGAGPLSEGKAWVTGMSRAGDDILEVIFNMDVTLDPGQANGYWCTDAGGNVQQAYFVEQSQANAALVYFSNGVGSPGRAGLADGFAGIVGVPALAPVTWRLA